MCYGGVLGRAKLIQTSLLCSFVQEESMSHWGKEVNGGEHIILKLWAISLRIRLLSSERTGEHLCPVLKLEVLKKSCGHEKRAKYSSLPWHMNVKHWLKAYSLHVSKALSCQNGGMRYFDLFWAFRCFRYEVLTWICLFFQHSNRRSNYLHSHVCKKSLVGFFLAVLEVVDECSCQHNERQYDSRSQPENVFSHLCFPFLGLLSVIFVLVPSFYV